jgi:hypothetical protein
MTQSVPYAQPHRATVVLKKEIENETCLICHQRRIGVGWIASSVLLSSDGRIVAFVLTRWNGNSCANLQAMREWIWATMAMTEWT